MSILQSILECELGWIVEQDVAESLLFQMESRHFVKKHEHDDGVSFLVSSEGNKTESGDTISELVVDFRGFVKDKSLLPKLSDEEIVDLFMSKIFEIIDASPTDEIGAAAEETADGWKVALVSDYVLRRTQENGSLPPLLKRLAELCLLREVVENYVRA